MGEAVNTTERTVKKSWFRGLKSEFRKIIWPDKESLAKQSVAVVVISVLLGVLIAAVDAVIKLGINLII